MSVQDRVGFYIADVTAEPTGTFGIAEAVGNPVLNGWGIDYAKDGSAFRVIVLDGGVYKSTDGGSTWAQVTSSIGGQAPLACQSATSFVIFPNGSAPVYTTDGATFSTSLFDGVPVSALWSGFFQNRNCVCADPTTPGTYYAFNIGAKGAFAATIVSGGSGYSVNQYLYFAAGTNGGGTFSPSTFLKVTGVNGSGAIISAIITDTGNTYSTPSNPVATCIAASAVAKASGGSGYAPGNVLTLAGGVGQKKAITVTVSTVDGSGAILTFTTAQNATQNVTTAPSNLYSGSGFFDSTQLPANPVSCTGGSGASATFNLTFPAGIGATFNLTFDNIGGCWKSIDGGANWARQFSGWIVYNAITLNAGAQCYQLSAVRGQAGHVLLSNGTAFSPVGVTGFLSTDAGLTFTPLKGITSCWMLCAGKAAPGAGYPALYFAGTCSIDSRPTVPGIFRADDVNPANLSATPTWVRLCDSPANNIASPSSMCGDWDIYGTFYIGMGPTGYAYGKLP